MVSTASLFFANSSATEPYLKIRTRARAYDKGHVCVCVCVCVCVKDSFVSSGNHVAMLEYYPPRQFAHIQITRPRSPRGQAVDSPQMDLLCSLPHVRAIAAAEVVDFLEETHQRPRLVGLVGDL